MSSLNLPESKLLDLFFHLHFWLVEDADKLADAILLELQSHVAELLCAIAILLL